MITDVPSWLKGGRLSDFEMQGVAQDFIFTRTDLYASDMLLLKYSIEEGQSKSEAKDKNVKDVVVIILMVKSPKVFKDFISDRYIHRFGYMTADSGLTYKSKATTIYVQLDKCLEQYKKGENGEGTDQL